MAAVLACGPGAVLSPRSAAALWGLIRWDRPIEVTARNVRRRTGVLVHRSRTLSRAYHEDTFEEDRERDATLTAAGLRVVRVTWQRLTRQEQREAARFRACSLKRKRREGAARGPPADGEPSTG